ncbi:ABC transporter substrate-binding protein [Bordetella hinzii]|uniref:TRAP transporter substrate-binding protein n=1 Tax=Bordetella hinzii TaxID=103855 RepID=UPI0013EFC710|nr:TRAP transporter substrate-binding protein DctP [Bordetella hinzii]QII86908.1 ABC transporter substrate-binding protein [Bordetella hinzii]
MQRRSFLKHAGMGAMAGSAAVAAPVFAQDMPSLSWRLASGFNPELEALYGAGEAFCKYVGEATGGKFSIRQSPGGEIAPDTTVLDAVSNHTVDCGHGFSSAYFDKAPALCFDSAVPFGLNARQMNAWMFEGDGLKLTRELFKPHKIVNLPMGNTGVQMGGWYRKEIKTLEDLKGVRMQTAGLAGEVLARLGVAPQQLAAAELAASLEKDALDAVQAASPVDDEALGLQKLAKYYYYPGWWAGGVQASLYINEAAWEKLPKHYRSAIESASRAVHVGVTASYDARNPAAMRRLAAAGAELRAFPRAVLDAAFEASVQVCQAWSDKDPAFKTLHENYMGFQDDVLPWFRISENASDQYLMSMALAVRRRR